MKVAGIIAEYNPFHNGHALLIQKVRESGVSHVVAVMSGNFVQRGEPALMHHCERTKAALENGVDLVLQLPSVYAVSSARNFASAAVRIIDGTGCADLLAFGSECEDTKKIERAAELICSDKIKPLLARECQKGITFAAARENALRLLDPECADIIKTPNNILAVEYVSALKESESRIKPAAFKRIGANHDSDEYSSDIASAYTIRELLLKGGFAENFVPEKAAEIYRSANFARINNIEKAVLYKIKTTEAKKLALAPDVGEGIENRISAAAKEARSLNELYAAAKTKRYTHARIRRIVMNCFLCVTAEDLAIPVPYIRIMGFNERGAELIRKMKTTAKLPVVTKASDFLNLSAEAKRIFSLECTAGDIYSLCMPENSAYIAEKSISPIIIK